MRRRFCLCSYESSRGLDCFIISLQEALHGFGPRAFASAGERSLSHELPSAMVIHQLLQQVPVTGCLLFFIDALCAEQAGESIGYEIADTF